MVGILTILGATEGRGIGYYLIHCSFVSNELSAANRHPSCVPK